jgi:hypothetical protein
MRDAYLIPLATIASAILGAFIGPLFLDAISPPTNTSTPIITIENKLPLITDSQEQNSEPTEVAQNQPPSINKLDSTPNSPQTAGAIITWTADASDPDGDRIYYQYILNGDQKTGWIKENEWTWQTSNEYIDKNIIEVLVMDMNHAAPSGSDDRKSDSFTILSPHEDEMQESLDYSPEQQPSQTAASPSYKSEVPDSNINSRVSDTKARLAAARERLSQQTEDDAPAGNASSSSTPPGVSPGT